MSFLSRLRMSAPGQGSGTDEAPAPLEAVEGLSETEVSRATELRSALDEDPNDVDAFVELADYVRRNASAVALADPLTADSPEGRDPGREENLAVWALAEELAGRPKAWFPLLELARLSVADDPDFALRRLGSAVEREPSGVALQEAIAILREAGRAVDGYNLGIAHWLPREHGVATGRELVLAALQAERHADARRTLADLEESGAEGADAVVAELREQVDADHQA